MPQAAAAAVVAVAVIPGEVAREEVVREVAEVPEVEQGVVAVLELAAPEPVARLRRAKARQRSRQRCRRETRSGHRNRP